MKKILIICLMVLLIGCNEVSNETVTGYTYDEPLILTMYSEDIKKEDVGFNNPVAEEIARLTGVRMDTQYPVENVSDKIDLMVNSGDYPDLIMVKDTHKMVDAGAYIDLAPLIEAHGPNIKKLYEDYFGRLKFSEEDPAIYVLPTAPVDTVNYKPVQGFKLQHAVVKALGYPKMDILKDFEKAIKDYMEMYPEIDGEKTIGISFVMEDWRWKVTVGNSGGFTTGVPDDGNWYIDPETYEATYRFLRPEEKEYYRWLNRMYHEGYVDPDSFVQSLDSYYAKIASGRVLGLMDTTWNSEYGEQLLRSQGKVERMYGTYPIQVDYSTKAADYRESGYIGGYGIGISKDCADPVAAIKFLDFMTSEEGQILRNWGIENIHYYYNDQGFRQIYDEERQKKITDVNYPSITGIGLYLYPYPLWGQGVKDSTGNDFDPDGKEFIINSYTEIEREVLEAYNAETWSDLYPSSDELPISKWGEAWDIPIPSDSEVRYQLDACDKIMKQGIVSAIVAPMEDFDAVWSGLMRDLEASGVYEMNKDFTEIVKNRIEFWSK